MINFCAHYGGHLILFYFCYPYSFHKEPSHVGRYYCHSFDGSKRDGACVFGTNRTFAWLQREPHIGCKAHTVSSERWYASKRAFRNPALRFDAPGAVPCILSLLHGAEIHITRVVYVPFSCSLNSRALWMDKQRAVRSNANKDSTDSTNCDRNGKPINKQKLLSCFNVIEKKPFNTCRLFMKLSFDTAHY